MALWVCGGEAGCGTKYAVGLFRCPRCHNTAFFEDGDPMAKISRHSGASDHTVPAPEAAVEDVDAPAPEPSSEGVSAVEPLDVTEFMAGPAEPVVEGGEESSPGSSSSASTETPQQSSEPSSKPSPKRVRKTASRSVKDQTESPFVPSTDGGPEDGTSATDGVE